MIRGKPRPSAFVAASPASGARPQDTATTWWTGPTATTPRSLPHAPLTDPAPVAALGPRLLTPLGLRSLAPGHPAYCASCHGAPLARDGAYHQGTVWGWLLGPFALAHARVYGDRAAALALLEPMRHHLDDYGVGSIAEIFDGAAPFLPRGCPAQAWSVAETLRAWQALAGGTPPRGARRRMSRRS